MHACMHVSVLGKTRFRTDVGRVGISASCDTLPVYCGVHDMNTRGVV